MNLTTDLLNVSDKMIDLTLGKILHRIFSLLSGRKVFFFLYEKKKTTVCPCDEILAHRVSESQINNYLNIKKKKTQSTQTYQKYIDSDRFYDVNKRRLVYS